LLVKYNKRCSMLSELYLIFLQMEAEAIKTGVMGAYTLVKLLGEGATSIVMLG